MTGATFTITNPGGYGALIGTPILPVSTTAIIDVEAILKRPVVITDEEGEDTIGDPHNDVPGDDPTTTGSSTAPTPRSSCAT